MSGTSAEARTANLLRYRLSGRGPNSFILASIVSGFTWYFTNQQIKEFNTRQQELITRVEKEETADNCNPITTQSNPSSTTAPPKTGRARRSTSMGSWAPAASS
jgi:hypothetical protein